MIKNRNLLISIIVVILVLCVITIDRYRKIELLRKMNKEEFDNFDIQAYKNYVTGGTYNVEQAPSKIKDFTPTKTSELITTCDESLGECMEW